MRVAWRHQHQRVPVRYRWAALNFIRMYFVKSSISTHRGISTLFFLWRYDPTRVMAYSFLRFLDHTQRRTTVGRIPLDEWSARRRDLFLTTHNTHNRQASMPPVEFEPTISAGGRPQTHARPRGHWDRQYPHLRGWIWYSMTFMNPCIVIQL
jgi:hypothetical protein